MRRISTLLVQVCFPFILIAQENLPVNQEIQFEVLTDSLTKNSKVQNLNVQIDCNNSITGQRFNLYFRGISGLPVLVDAIRNEETLWLIQSQNAASNDLVLAWYTVDDSRLQLVTGNWEAPYTLKINIQLSLNNLKDIQNISEAQIDLTLIRNETEYLAVPTGRGNQINLK